MAIQQLLQSRQGGIPPQMMALLELEQAKQALMQSGVAPGTVAGQKVQEAQMLTQPPQQPGMEDLMPGVQQRAGEMAQAQQPVTQAQLQQAMAQRAPGIAGLPVDIEMAEGGIVGYSGTTGSLVGNLSAEELAKMSPEMRKAYFREMAERRAAAGPTYATPEAASSTRGAASAARGIGSALKRLTPLALMSELFTTPEEDIDLLRQAEATRNAGVVTDTGDEVARLAAKFEKPTTPTAQQLEAQVKEAAGRSYQPDASLFRGAASRPPAAPAAAPAASGVASLMGPMMPSASDVEFGRQKAAIQQMLEAAQKPTEESPQDKALRAAREAEIARQTGAIDAARQRFTESQEKQKSQDLIDFLMGVGGSSSLFGGMARSGQQLSQVQAAREAERIKYMDLLDTRNEAVGKLKLAQLTGDADLARESAKELRKNALEIQKLGVGLGERRMAELATEEREAAKTAAQSRENALERASREKMEGMRLKQQAEQTGQMQLANRINAANMTVAAAIEKMDKDLDKKYGQLLSFKKMMPPDQFNKNAGYVEEYQRYLKEYDEKYKIAVEPAVKERDRLAAMITAGQDLSKWGEPQVKTGR